MQRSVHPDIHAAAVYYRVGPAAQWMLLRALMRILFDQWVEDNAKIFVGCYLWQDLWVWVGSFRIENIYLGSFSFTQNVCVFVYIYVYMCFCVYMCVQVCIWAHVPAYSCVCMHVCTYACVHVCIVHA